MTILFSFLLIAVGLLLLIKGADWLVSGASGLALSLGLAPIVIGLTVVSFGTSMPELVVNLLSTVRGSTDLAIANIIGSNIANILLILGCASLVYPLTIHRNTTWKEIPFSLLAVVLVLLMTSDIALAGQSTNVLDRIDGLVLLSFFVIFLYYTFGISKTEGEGESIERMRPLRAISLVVVGVGALVLGGKLTVDAAVTLASLAGISERVIGLTVVAIGTSLPELITSVMAAYRRHVDIAVGNVVGSNIFNVFWILGLSSSIKPLPVSSGSAADILVAVAASLFLFAAMFLGKKHILERWQGALMIIAYVAYLVWLATGSISA